MTVIKNYISSVELLKYPYCGTSEDTEDYLSNKICSLTIKTRKNIIKKTKYFIFYGDCILRLTTGVVPSQAIGLPILPTTRPVMESRYSNINLSKKALIAQISRELPTEMDFTEKEIDQFYNFSIEYINNELSQDELISKINNLRGGSLIDRAKYLVWLGLLIKKIDEILAFQPNANQIIPPHLEWLYGNHKPGNHFGYGKEYGPRSLAVTGLTKNAGSEKKDPSSGSYNYIDLKQELKAKIKQKQITIEVAGQTYNIKNTRTAPFAYVQELEDILADQIYDSIRECNTDISDIAENVGFKVENIKKLKDYVFYDKHRFEPYAPDELEEYKRLDPDFQQALAWKRLEAGIHNERDIVWLKHEYRERCYELKHDAAYKESHEQAQKRYDGCPWTKDD